MRRYLKVIIAPREHVQKQAYYFPGMSTQQRIHTRIHLMRANLFPIC